MNHPETDETRGEGLSRITPALLILLMTVASWVGLVMVFRNAIQYGLSSQTTAVETIYDPIGGR